MSHHATSMASKKNPPERFAKVVWRVNNSRDVTHLDLLVVGPILDRKMLYIDVFSAFRLIGRTKVFGDETNNDGLNNVNQ